MEALGYASIVCDQYSTSSNGLSIGEVDESNGRYREEIIIFMARFSGSSTISLRDRV